MKKNKKFDFLELKVNITSFSKTDWFEDEVVVGIGA